jgi:hypothetical protein
VDEHLVGEEEEEIYPTGCGSQWEYRKGRVETFWLGRWVWTVGGYFISSGPNGTWDKIFLWNKSTLCPFASDWISSSVEKLFEKQCK